MRIKTIINTIGGTTVKKILFLAILVAPLLSFASTTDEQIRNICGTHPVIGYMKDFKGNLMDSEIVNHIEKCVEGAADAKVWNWDLGDAKIQGCLVQKFGHEKEYIKTIADEFSDAKQLVSDQTSHYNDCANSVRDCGKSSCKKNAVVVQQPKVEDRISETLCHYNQGRSEHHTTKTLAVKATSGWEIIPDSVVVKKTKHTSTDRRPFGRCWVDSASKYRFYLRCNPTPETRHDGATICAKAEYKEIKG